jgi:hypothetical protein
MLGCSDDWNPMSYVCTYYLSHTKPIAELMICRMKGKWEREPTSDVMG